MSDPTTISPARSNEEEPIVHRENQRRQRRIQHLDHQSSTTDKLTIRASRLRFSRVVDIASPSSIKATTCTRSTCIGTTSRSQRSAEKKHLAFLRIPFS